MSLLSAQEINIILRAQNSASAALKEVAGDLSRLGSQGSSVSAMLVPVGAALAKIAVAGGTALAAGLGIGIKSAGDLEQAVANISTIKPDIDTSAVFASLNEMSTRIPQSAAQLGEGLYNVFSSMEVTQAEALSLMETFTKGAVGSQTDAATFGTAAIGVMNAYKLSAKDAGDVSDWFFDIINKGVVTGPELAASLGPVTQAAKAAGVEWRDLGPMIAAATKEGGPAAQNINNLNNFLQKFSTKEAQKELGNLGITTKTAAGDLRSPLEVLTDLKKRTEGMTEAARANAMQEIFPDAQARMGAEVLMSQLDMVRQGTEEAQKSSGSADAAYTKMSQTFNSQSKLMVNGLLAIGTSIGGELLPHITPLVTKFSKELPGAFASARAAAAPLADVGRQVGDAWRTVRQAFEGNWSPSDKIEPFALAAGKAAIEARKLNIESDRLKESFTGLGQSLSILNNQFGEADWVVILSGALRKTGENIAGVIDAFVSLARVGLDLISMVVSVGRALAKLATGDLPGMEAALKDGDKAFADMLATGEGFATRTADRITQGMAKTRSAIESNMQAANQAVGENSAGMQRFMEENGAGVVAAAEAAGQGVATGMATGTADALAAVDDFNIGAVATTNDLMVQMGAAVDQGMTGVVTATDSGMTTAVGAVTAAGPQFATAATAAGTAASEGIASAAPAMAAAAESGATGAVAAVQGQSGAANAAGASVGTNIGDGMVAGIASRAAAVWAAAKSLMSQALGGAEAEAEIRSPSKRTMYMGQMLDQGLIDGIEGSAPNVRAAMQALLKDVTDYGPAAAQIAQVEKRIKEIRDEANTAALFRSEQMITIDSEALRLRREMVNAEKDLVGPRQEIARVSREIGDIERGTLDVRRQMIQFSAVSAEQNKRVNEIEKEKIPLRARELEIERQLISLDPSSKRAEALKKEQEELRKKSGLIDNTIAQIRLQTRAQELDMASVKETQIIASAGARIRKEELEDQARGQDLNITLIKEALDVLGAEQAAFQANEAVIKNATDNEVAQRNRLIAVFTAEAKPIADRIAAGLALVTQLESEGKISKELADQLRSVGKEAGAGATAASSLGAAAAIAAPQMDAAAKNAAEVARQAAAISRASKDAEKDVLGLGKALGSWFIPKGSTSKSVLFGDSTATAIRSVPSLVESVSLAGVGAAPAGSRAVRERQPIIFQIGNRTLGQMVAEGMDMELRRVGSLPGGISL